MCSITPDRYDAVLFDMDGVLTATAHLHAVAWKRMFDEVLRERAQQTNEAFHPFDLDADFRIHVDGRRRHDGVRLFLESRGITIPPGTPDSPAHEISHHGLGNRKDALVSAVLQSEGVEVYQGSIRFLHHVRRQGIRTAVVSSSRNCRAVLSAAGIEGLFDVRVDGVVADERNIPGKPDPAMFLEAARALSVLPPRAAVIEDALSGVAAGRAGGFGLVVGIVRANDAAALRDAGADVVVADLGPWAE